MKKTGIIDLLRTIAKTKVSFISIAVFVMLATALFLGIDWSITAFENTVDATLNAGNMHDIEITHPYGLTDEFIEELLETDGVSEASGIYSVEKLMKYNNANYQAKISTLDDNTDIPTSYEGRLPEKENEIAIEKYWADKKGVRIGDTLSFQNGNGKELKSDVFTVTALMFSPVYVSQYNTTYGSSKSTGSPNDVLLFVSEEALNLNSFIGYSSVVVRSDELRAYNNFSDEYEKKSDELTDRIKGVAESYAKKINKEVKERYPFLTLEEYDCSVLGREANPALSTTVVPNDIMSKVKYTLAFLFVLIGMLVCFSAVSRIVFEQTVFIATKKALGIRKREIRGFYLAYVALAVVAGSIAGDFVARFLVEPVVVWIILKNYVTVAPVYAFVFSGSILFFVFEFAVTLLFAVIACEKVLKQKTTVLLTGQKKSNGKRRFFESCKLWKKLPLLSKTIINNCLNDTGRVFATIVGIVGCCSLIACSFTMLVSINDTKRRQRNDICLYDTIVYVDTNTENAVKNVKGVLSDNGIASAEANCSNAYLVKNEGAFPCTLLAFEDESFYDFFHVQTDGKDVDVTDGVWCCQIYSAENNLRKGDTVKLIDRKGIERTAEMGGSFDYYLVRDQLLVNKDTYESVFGEAYKANIVLLKRDSLSAEDISALLDETEGFISVFDSGMEAEQLLQGLSSPIIAIVATYLALSVVLAFIVLLNLLFMFVAEKKKELIIMMINGISRRETKKYIYCDTIFLSVIGIILGIILGVTVAFVTMKLLSTDPVNIIRTLSLPVCLASAAFTGILVAITCMIALRRVAKFKIRDINTM